MKYRKKPVVIDAFQITQPMHQELLSRKTLYFRASCIKKFPDWLKKAVNKSIGEGSLFVQSDLPIMRSEEYNFKLLIGTLEGNHEVTINDWIIKGVKNELYPCKDEIFKLTYEKVE